MSVVPGTGTDTGTPAAAADERRRIMLSWSVGVQVPQEPPESGTGLGRVSGLTTLGGPGEGRATTSTVNKWM